MTEYGRFRLILFRNHQNSFVESPFSRHCEEHIRFTQCKLRDAAISIFQTVMNCEIASLRNDTLFIQTFCECTKIIVLSYQKIQILSITQLSQFFDALFPQYFTINVPTISCN